MVETSKNETSHGCVFRVWFYGSFMGSQMRSSIVGVALSLLPLLISPAEAATHYCSRQLVADDVERYLGVASSVLTAFDVPTLPSMYDFEALQATSSVDLSIISVCPFSLVSLGIEHQQDQLRDLLSNGGFGGVDEWVAYTNAAFQVALYRYDPDVFSKLQNSLRELAESVSSLDEVDEEARSKAERDVLDAILILSNAETTTEQNASYLQAADQDKLARLFARE